MRHHIGVRMRNDEQKGCVPLRDHTHTHTHSGRTTVMTVCVSVCGSIYTYIYTHIYAVCNLTTLTLMRCFCVGDGDAVALSIVWRWTLERCHEQVADCAVVMAIVKGVPPVRFLCLSNRFCFQHCAKRCGSKVSIITTLTGGVGNVVSCCVRSLVVFS